LVINQGEEGPEERSLEKYREGRKRTYMKIAGSKGKGESRRIKVGK